MNENQMTLLRELQKENQWWSTGQVSPELSKTFRRADFYAYRDLLNEAYAKVVVGPRRVGKSTILYQLIDYLIREIKVSPNRIIFLSLERPFFSMIKNPIKESLRVFEETILKEPLESLKEPAFVFLDEASRNEDWALEVKEYFDRKYKVQFFITGSSSPALFAKSSESLVGRHSPLIMLALKFSDVVKLDNNPKLEKLLALTKKIALRESFLDAVEKNDPKKFFETARDIYVTFGPEGETLMQLMLNQYLLRGGYPEFYEKKSNWGEASKIMREAYFDAIISYDLLRVFKSRNPEKIKQLYTFLGVYTAQQVNLSNLCRDIGISRTALNDYLSQLQQTYLIKVMRPYKKNKIKVGNDLKKIYVGDVGMRNAVLGITEEEITDPVLLGRLAETIAQDHTLRLKYILDRKSECKNFFWKSGNKEVDIILELSGKIIPIESKYAEQIRSEDVQELRNVTTQKNCPFGILLTKKSFQYDEKSKTISMPLWLYLLMC